MTTRYIQHISFDFFEGGNVMAKSAVARQFFIDLIENLGDHIDVEETFEQEESTLILTDMFFGGALAIMWNPETDTLMLKPTTICKFKETNVDA